MRGERRAGEALRFHPNRFHQSNGVHQLFRLFLRCPRRLQRPQMTLIRGCSGCHRYCESKSVSLKIAAVAAVLEDSFASVSLPAVVVVVVADGGGDDE